VTCLLPAVPQSLSIVMDVRAQPGHLRSRPTSSVTRHSLRAQDVAHGEFPVPTFLTNEPVRHAHHGTGMLITWLQSAMVAPSLWPRTVTDGPTCGAQVTA